MKLLGRSLVFLLFFFQCIFYGCNYTHFKNADSDFRHTKPLNQKEQESIGYGTIFRDVIEPYCLACHRSGNYPLNNYRETLAILEQIRESVFVTGSMPKDRNLPGPERSLLLAWLDNGAPELAKELPAPPPPLEATFTYIRERIFKVRCGDCHIPSSAYCSNDTNRSSDDEVAYRNKESCRLELLNYQELLFGEESTNKEIILPGNANDSQLMITIRGTEDRQPTMPPKEAGYNWLSPEEIKVIEDWINLGALNN